MATPHLTCRSAATDLSETKGRLMALGGDDPHLLIVRRGSAWSNKELVVTPDKEYYACAVSYLDYSDYPAADVVGILGTLVNNHEAAWVALDETAWREGHKPCLQYLARGHGPWHVLKNNLKPYSAYYELEYGGSRQALRFNLRGLPTIMGGPYATAAFSAKLRFWNPSAVAVVGGPNWLDYEDAAYETSLKNTKPIVRGQTMGVYSGRTNCGRAFYAFHADGISQPPNVGIFDSNPNSVQFVGFANEGKSAETNVYLLRYDPWNIHHYSSAPAADQRGVHTAIYAQGTFGNTSSFSSAPYCVDHSITGTQLDNLKRAVRDGHGSCWLLIGFRPYVAASSDSSVYIGSDVTQTFYFSRVELVLTVSGIKFN